MRITLQENKELLLTAMQGAEPRYDLNLDKDTRS